MREAVLLHQRQRGGVVLLCLPRESCRGGSANRHHVPAAGCRRQSNAAGRASQLDAHECTGPSHRLPPSKHCPPMCARHHRPSEGRVPRQALLLAQHAQTPPTAAQHPPQMMSVASSIPGTRASSVSHTRLQRHAARQGSCRGLPLECTMAFPRPATLRPLRLSARGWARRGAAGATGRATAADTHLNSDSVYSLLMALSTASLPLCTGTCR